MTKSGQVMKDAGVKVMLDKERTLKFDMNALCELEDSGLGFEEIAEGLMERNFKKIRTILHAVMAHEEDETFTVKQVGALVNMQNMEKVVSALAEALQASAPEHDVADKEQGNETGK